MSTSSTPRSGSITQKVQEHQENTFHDASTEDKNVQAAALSALDHQSASPRDLASTSETIQDVKKEENLPAQESESVAVHNGPSLFRRAVSSGIICAGIGIGVQAGRNKIEINDLAIGLGVGSAVGTTYAWFSHRKSSPE